MSEEAPVAAILQIRAANSCNTLFQGTEWEVERKEQKHPSAYIIPLREHCKGRGSTQKAGGGETRI